MLLRRLANPATSGLIFRRVYDDLKKNHIDKFFEEFPGLFRFYRASDHEIILPGQDGKAPSRIVFAYAETETEVKRKFYGPEWMDMFVDQAEQLSEKELKTMKTACRWPGVPDYQCKFGMFFNPGGTGISFFRRVFRLKEFQERESAEDFKFIQAYGWDNVEWVRNALMDDGFSPVCEEEENCYCAECTFYSWTDKERFDYFIARSQYGRDLNSLPQAMRIGHLMGSLDEFAGQYFDIWDPSRHTVRHGDLQICSWHPKWISIDWGMAHNSVALWHAQDGVVTKTYREFVRSGLGPRALAQEIADRCKLENEIEKIDAIYISPDTRAKRTNEDTILQQMGDALRQRGLPYPRIADDDRKSGWLLMHEMLQYNRWVISHNCVELIKNIPLFARDEEDPEDCVKFEGDDAGDSARYGLKSRFSSREAPRQVQLAHRITAVKERMNTAGRDLGAIHTAMHLEHKKFEAEWQKKKQPVRFIRNWRGRR